MSTKTYVEWSGRPEEFKMSFSKLKKSMQTEINNGDITVDAIRKVYELLIKGKQ